MRAARVLLEWIKRHESVLSTLVLVAALAWRWPILKGYYYKLAGIEASASPIAWRTEYRAALAESVRTGRPVLVDFSASWCPPCIAMKHDTWTDPEVVRAVTASFVPLMVDIDRDPATAEHYGVESIPTIMLVDGSGAVVRQAGFLPASGMRRFIRGD